MDFLNSMRYPSPQLSKRYWLFILVGVLCLAPWVCVFTGGNYWVRVLDFALLYVFLALGLNIVVGFAGLLDLGYIAFYAVGAYAAGLLASPHLANSFSTISAIFPGGVHTSYWIILPIAALVAAFFGILLGAPTLKLRGDYLAIVTLGFGEIIRIFLNNLGQNHGSGVHSSHGGNVASTAVGHCGCHSPFGTRVPTDTAWARRPGRGW